jgi:hypothetical protein
MCRLRRNVPILSRRCASPKAPTMEIALDLILLAVLVACIAFWLAWFARLL